jgi:hypothetical protein
MAAAGALNVRRFSHDRLEMLRLRLFSPLKIVVDAPKTQEANNLHPDITESGNKSVLLTY